MEKVVKARVVRVGNSCGIRIPKIWADQLGLDDEVELAVQKEKLVIRRAHHPREVGGGFSIHGGTRRRPSG